MREDNAATMVATTKTETEIEIGTETETEIAKEDKKDKVATAREADSVVANPNLCL